MSDVMRDQSHRIANKTRKLMDELIQDIADEIIAEADDYSNTQEESGYIINEVLNDEMLNEWLSNYQGIFKRKLKHRVEESLS